jgi:prevent-host-death family protein
MARRYSIAEARSRFAAIVEQAATGVDVELTHRGQPLVVVVSRSRLDQLRGERPDFGTAYRRFLQKFSLDEIGLERDLADTRDRTTGRRVPL